MITKAGHILIPYIGRGIIQQPLEFSLANYSNGPFSIHSIAFFSNHPLLVSLFSDYQCIGSFISSPTMMINLIRFDFKFDFKQSLFLRVTNDSENTVDLYYQIEFLGNIDVFERRNEQYPINERPAHVQAEQPVQPTTQPEEKSEEHIVDDPRIRGLFEE